MSYVALLLGGALYALAWMRRTNAEARDADAFDEHTATAMALLTPDALGDIGPAREWCALTAEQEGAFAEIAAGCPELGGVE